MFILKVINTLKQLLIIVAAIIIQYDEDISPYFCAPSGRASALQAPSHKGLMLTSLFALSVFVRFQ